MIAPALLTPGIAGARRLAVLLPRLGGVVFFHVPTLSFFGLSVTESQRKTTAAQGLSVASRGGLS